MALKKSAKKILNKIKTYLVQLVLRYLSEIKA